MGKEWDKAVPPVAIWKECLRVLKPGAFAFVMCIPRSDCQAKMVTNLMEAGFCVNFSPIYHTFASGFPKSQNISKAIDRKLGAEREVISQSKSGGYGHINKDNKEQGYRPTDYYEENGNTYRSNVPQTPQAKVLDGSYTYNPKPAVEIVLVAMKPLSEKSYTEQAMKNGKGIVYFDDCRMPLSQKGDEWNKAQYPHKTKGYNSTSYNIDYQRMSMTNPQGRFPANLLCSSGIYVNIKELLELQARVNYHDLNHL